MNQNFQKVFEFILNFYNFFLRFSTKTVFQLAYLVVTVEYAYFFSIEIFLLHHTEKKNINLKKSNFI